MASRPLLRHRILQWWRALSDRQRDFALNIMIGSLISVLLTPIETTVVVSSLRDTMLTWQVSQFAGTDIGASLAFVDIDDQTHVSSWGSPYYTPRDKLCRLIDYSARAGARAIVVDIDLSAPSPGTAQRAHLRLDHQAETRSPSHPRTQTKFSPSTCSHTNTAPIAQKHEAVVPPSYSRAACERQGPTYFQTARRRTNRNHPSSTRSDATLTQSRSEPPTSMSTPTRWFAAGACGSRSANGCKVMRFPRPRCSQWRPTTAKIS